MTWIVWDRNQDGKITADEIFTNVRIAVYIFCGLWCCLHPEEYTTGKYLGTIAASFGASVFERFLLNWRHRDSRIENNSDNYKPHYNKEEP